MERRIATAASALVLALIVISGCDEVPEGEGETGPFLQKTPRGADSSTGTVRGHVEWLGARPAVPRLEGCSNPIIENGPRQRVVVSNPNEPCIDSEAGGVSNAIIFLQGIDPAAARQWDHPPVRILERDYRLRVLQGPCDSSVGFVRVGSEIEMESADPFFHSIHAEGAAWFSLTFPDPGQPLRRALMREGLVELTSAVGYYWMRAYLFVDEHPYYARTDARGDFALERVPPGDYDLVCWMPNWLEERHERDPESSLIIRLSFRPPVERRRRINVRANATTSATFEVWSGLFSR